MSKTQTRYDIAPYAELDIPVYRETPPSPLGGDTGNWSQVVTVANVLLAVIIIIGMLWEGRSIALSIVAGALYYAVTTLGVIALISGQASAMWQTWQAERTERRRIDAYEYLAERKLELETPQIAQDPVQTPSALPEGDRYVPAYTPQVIDEARRYVLSLYRRDGYLDPKKVRSGHVQGSIIGSKRGEGSADAKRLLIDRRIIKPVEGGYKYAERRLPHRDDVERLFYRIQGRGG